MSCYFEIDKFRICTLLMIFSDSFNNNFDKGFVHY